MAQGRQDRGYQAGSQTAEVCGAGQPVHVPGAHLGQHAAPGVRATLPWCVAHMVWRDALTRACGARVAEERRMYDEAAAAGPALAPGQEPDLGMRVILVHGTQPRLPNIMLLRHLAM